MNTPTNRFEGALPEDQTGQPYTFSDYLDDAREALSEADRMKRNPIMKADVAKQRALEALANAEQLIEQARRML